MQCILYGAGRSNVLSNLNESRTVFGVWLKWIWLYLSSDFCLWSSIPLRDIAASWVHTMPGRKNLFHEVAWHLAWMLISWPPFIFFSLFLSCATVLALKVVQLTNIFLPHNSSLRARRRTAALFVSARILVRTLLEKRISYLSYTKWNLFVKTF